MKRKWIIIAAILLSINIGISSQKIIIDGIPMDTSYTLYSAFTKQKKYHPHIQLADTVTPANIKAYNHISYKSFKNKRHLHLSIYRPDDNNVYPVVLMVHGGGWNSGSPDMLKALAVNLAQRGYVTATVEYRLIPEALYPAAVNDLEDAVGWIRKHGHKYGYDLNKIAVLGGSAGGQLANLIGTKNKRKIIKAIVNVDGISTFTSEESIGRAEKARSSNAPLPIDAVWLGGTYLEKKSNWEKASPLFSIHKNSAPICFINSSIPRFHNGRDEHIELLNKLNIYSEVHELEHSPHTFWLFHPWHEPTVQFTDEFLKKIFNP